MVRTMNRSKRHLRSSMIREKTMSDNAVSNAEHKRSESTGGVEQFTKALRNVPKRVAAGKKLVESNKRIREEHERVMQRILERNAKDS